MAKYNAEETQAIKSMPRGIQQHMIEVNARLFEAAVKEEGCSLAAFADAFMRSETAEWFDCSMNPFRWQGVRELMIEFKNELLEKGIKLLKAGSEDLKFFSLRIEQAYWMGYIYRLTHFLTAESSADIVDFMPSEDMLVYYHSGHLMDPKAWIFDYYNDDDDRERFWRAFEDIVAQERNAPGNNTPSK